MFVDLPALTLLLLLPTAASSQEIPEVLLSRQLVDSQQLQIGAIVQLASEPDGSDARPFRLVGSYEPVPDPMRLVSRRLEARLHLPDLLQLTDPGNDPHHGESVNAINIALADPDDAPAFTRELVARVPGLAARPTAVPDQDAATFEVLERFHLAIALITVLGSTAFLLALMLMRAEERRETVGILRLIGLSKRRVLLEVFFEGLIIAVVGALFGVIVAILLQGLFNHFFQWYYDTALIFVRVTPMLALRCVALAVPLGVLAGLAASWSLLRRDVLELIRR